MKNRLNVIKDMVFIIIFIILLNICTNIFVLKGNGYGSDVTSFYNLKSNSLDLIFFGSSHSYSAYSPNIIEKETGLNSYNFATQQQPIYITYHYMVEALKTQHPKYFVLETYMLPVNGDYAEEGVTRDAIDKMHLSINKINAIKISVENKEDYPSYYFNIIKYHSRYENLSKRDIKEGLINKGLENRGYIALPNNDEVEVDNTEFLKIKEKQQISDKNLEYLDKIIELTEKNNIKLIFVNSPCALNANNQQKLNWLKDYVSEKQIDFIDYNELFDELKFVKGDFYDSGHLSGDGAKKVSNHFSNYLNSLEK